MDKSLCARGKKRRFGLALSSFFSISICIFSLMSCAPFNEPIREWFEEYTDNAAIEEIVINDVIKNPQGVDCIGSENSRVFYFYLRNPRDYELSFGYEFDDELIASVANTISDSVVVQQGIERNTGYLAFSKEFLKEVDKKAGSIEKAISGRITVNELYTGRPFASFDVKLHSNSAPMKIQNACYQRNKEEADGAKYIICFYMPDFTNAENIVHKNDTHVIYVNGQKKYFSGTTFYNSAEFNELTGEWTFSDQDTSFTTSYTSVYKLNDNPNAFQFDHYDAPSGYKPVYYITDKEITDSEENFSFKIEDDDGLFSEVSFSTRTSRLTSPVLEVSDGDRRGADENTSTYALLISHDGKDMLDQNCGNVYINYTINELDGRNVFAEGTSSSITGRSNGTAIINLPKGRYEIITTAEKNYYITSYETYIWNFTVTSQANFYVRNNGTDSLAHGSKTKPFRTIKYAVDRFAEGVQDGSYSVDDICNIYIMSNLTLPADNSGTIEDKFAVIDNTIGVVNIIGYQGTRTINLDREGEENCLAVEIYGSAIFKNLVISGGRSPYHSGYSLFNVISDAYLEFDNVVIEYNNLDYIVYSSGGTVVINDSVIRYNDTDFTIYSDNGLSLENSKIENNKGKQCGGLYCLGWLGLYGKNIIFGNTNEDGSEVSDVILPEDSGWVYVCNNIAGSKFGVKKYFDSNNRPSAANPQQFTIDYSRYTSQKPEEIFISQNDYNIVLNNGEAAFAASGGSMYDADKYTFNFTLGTESFYPGVAKDILIYVGADCGYNTFKIDEDGYLYTTNYYGEITYKSKNPVIWTADLYSGKTKITPLQVTYEGLYYGSGASLKVRMPSSIKYCGKYTIKMNAQFMGVIHDMNLTVSGARDFLTVSGMLNDCDDNANLGVVKIEGSIDGNNLKQSIAGTIKRKSLRVKLDLSDLNLEWYDTYDYVFADCVTLQEIILPPDLTKICSGWFSNCTGLTKVTLPSSLTEIMQNAFGGCTSLSQIYYNGSSTQWKNFRKAGSWRKNVSATIVHCSDNVSVDLNAAIGPKSVAHGDVMQPGDIVFYDKSFVSYSDTLELTEEQKGYAIAVVFYRGNECTKIKDNGRTRILAVGLYNSAEDDTKHAWANGYSSYCYNTIKPSDNSDETYSEYDGSTNFSRYDWYCYAYQYVANYDSNHGLYQSDYQDVWYLPTLIEAQKIYSSLDMVNSSLRKVDGTELISDRYWTSTEDSAYNSRAYYINFSTGSFESTSKMNNNYSLAIFEIR